MLPHDARVGFERTLDLVRGFAHDLKTRQAQSGTERKLEEFWAAEMKNDVIAGPVSRHEQSLPPPGCSGLAVERLLSRRAREIQSLGIRSCGYHKPSVGAPAVDVGGRK